MPSATRSRAAFPTPGQETKKQIQSNVFLICLIPLAIMIIGMANLYSASIGAPYFWNQLKNLAVTIFAFIMVGWIIPLRMVKSYAYLIYGGVCALLLIVFLTGKIAGGAQRWISLGPLSFQPSEFAKLAVVLLTAKYLGTYKTIDSFRIRDLAPLFLAFGVAFGLIFSQPDFGTAGMCLLILIAQLSFIKINTRSLWLVLGTVPIIGFVGWTMLLKPYQKLRVLNFLNPNLDPQNTGYNSLQSLVAIGSGELTGKGYLQGTQSQLKFLPEKHTDFIFAVFAEEHGFWGCLVVFFLFTTLTLIALDVAKRAKDSFAGFAAVGIASFIFIEFTINIAMVLGLFPVVGLPLPFFSYGSSLLLTVCTALGLLVAINRSTYAKSNF